ncbi:DUF4148 domain-containing protein [Paraburkholderia sp.]|uniref:DUF4148 domain-containing protein n=1 Tax=Paraburkholderia sp. TaxID=1926495 RepID=UPI00239E51D5|nr:DUF4148 domain-containing protein [Paraburkholderia sp.]MDE1179691.1 DUF4148 domain-containing protein [Paraburkholderia sp.]
MQRPLYTSIAGLVLSVAASNAAYADGGIGHAGTYQSAATAGASQKTRAEVRAELIAAYRSGSLPSMNRQAYPGVGLQGETQAARLAIQEGTETTRIAHD